MKAANVLGLNSYNTSSEDKLQVERSGDQIMCRARSSASVEDEPGALPASCTMGTSSVFPWGWEGKATGKWR
jgi:hypothetical protein